MILLYDITELNVIHINCVTITLLVDSNKVSSTIQSRAQYIFQAFLGNIVIDVKIMNFICSYLLL